MAIAAVAAMLSMPPLGQQEQIRDRRNAPGERLLPPPPPRKKRARDFTPLDLERIAMAEAKRERRGIRNSRNLAAGCARQTATPRDKPATDGAVASGKDEQQ